MENMIATQHPALEPGPLPSGSDLKLPSLKVKGWIISDDDINEDIFMTAIIFSINNERVSFHHQWKIINPKHDFQVECLDFLNYSGP